MVYSHLTLKMSDSQVIQYLLELVNKRRTKNKLTQQQIVELLAPKPVVLPPPPTPSTVENKPTPCPPPQSLCHPEPKVKKPRKPRKKVTTPVSSEEEHVMSD